MTIEYWESHDCGIPPVVVSAVRRSWGAIPMRNFGGLVLLLAGIGVALLVYLPAPVGRLLCAPPIWQLSSSNPSLA